MLKIIIWYAAVQLVLFLIVFIISAWKDRRLHDKQGTEVPVGFVATEEVSYDPVTGDLITVYYNPGTGKRFYKQGK
ncbi:hypothetical protein [Paenibacillus apiarius]|uniref:hypothetical protein n=1 Tax=Paenibacillus apiarius TaxID=46240 RepID=UPI0019815E22|nr:hypothetical protein [Paenibacillus apiarius]MBN3527200.1 hypothetical protein [Paenibacillus apiarius]